LIWISFIIQPFLTLLYTLRNYRASFAKNIIWAFATFFGMTVAVGFDSSGMDIVRYMEEVQSLHNSGIQLTGWYDYYVSTGSIDVVRTILSLIVSQFTDNGYYMIIIYGFIYGYFYSRNMWFVIDKLEGRLKYITVLMLVCMFLVIPIWYLNTFRFWTASHMFIYGILPYLYNGKKQSLIWCFLAIFLFHFAYILPALVLAFFIFLRPFLKNSTTVFFLFFVVSIFVSEINLNQFNYFVDTYVPDAFAERSRGYRSEEYANYLRYGGEQGTGMVWYAAYYFRALQVSMITFLIILFVKSRNLIKYDTNFSRALSFTYLLFGVGNIMSSIPSGNRYVIPAVLLATSILTIYIQNVKQDIVMQRAIKLSVPLLLLFIVVSLREGLYLTSMTTILGNPIIALFTVGENLSMNDVLKSIFR